MKTNLSYYIHQFRQIYDGEPWYGESLMQKLETVDPGEAFVQPAPGVHSPAQIVGHLLAWRQLLAERIRGNGDFRIDTDSSIDWPSVDQLRTKGWNVLLDDLAANQTELLRLLEAETDELLDRPLPGGKKTFRNLLDGIQQHDIYHIGQIGLVFRLLRNDSRA